MAATLAERVDEGRWLFPLAVESSGLSINTMDQSYVHLKTAAL